MAAAQWSHPLCAVDVRVLFFAKSRELVGCSSSSCSLPTSCTSEQLQAALLLAFPSLSALGGAFVLSLNEDYVEGAVTLQPGDELAVIPPISGAISTSVTHPSTGATSVFIGTTRDNFEGKKVVRLEYEAFEAMAVKELRKVVAEVREQWEVHAVAIHHRLGLVAVTEASVVIAVSSPHRKEALEAVQFAIDKLKATVPIWKKEIYDEGGSSWKENKECEWRGGNSNSVKVNNKTDDESAQAPKMNFVDSSLVQVTASKSEIDRRIEAFIERKRNEINRTNIQEFCNRHSSEAADNSCARVDAVVVRKVDSKSHLRQSKANNEWGPLMGQQPTRKKRKLDPSIKSESSSHIDNKIPEALEERISAMEAQVKPNRPVPKGIYARLKELESRILFLEGVSPEYEGLLSSKCKCQARTKEMLTARPEEGSRQDEITESLSSLNNRINHLKNTLKLKAIKEEPIENM